MKDKSGIKLVPFSKKQRQLMNWWVDTCPVHDNDGIIADGSIRSGKTFPMAQSFVEWAMATFDSQLFGVAGKTISALRRNVINWLLPTLRQAGYKVAEHRTDNYFTVSGFGRSNTFYLFGGKDEQSQDLIQGVTLAGIYFDEVALMPESFVNQGTGRCSVEGAKFWFNCNPDSPSHWFKREWLDKAKEKRLLHLHFVMTDNPSLSLTTIARYSRMYVGVFFKRFILGLWVVAEGAIYDMWTEENVYEDGEVPQFKLDAAYHDIAIDYGTQNPMAFLDIADTGTEIYVDREYYYYGRKEGVQKTDSQYGDDLEKFARDVKVRYVIIDPSASSFIAEVKNRGFRVKQADNDVLPGIHMCATLIGLRLVRVNSSCINFIREVSSYVWDNKLTDKGKEQPVKNNDHALDAFRYWVKTLFKMRRLAS